VAYWDGLLPGEPTRVQIGARPPSISRCLIERDPVLAGHDRETLQAELALRIQEIMSGSSSKRDPLHLSRIAQLDQRTALPNQCLHSAEPDVRPAKRCSGFDRKRNSHPITKGGGRVAKTGSRKNNILHQTATRHGHVIGVSSQRRR
jgi:hypothetical protein